MAKLTGPEKQAFRQMLNAARNLVIADGKIDYGETTMLVGMIEPLAKSDPDCDALMKALIDVRADGVITDEESKRITSLIGLLSRKDSGLVYGIEERPPVVETFFAALQHLLAIFVSICTPPLIIAGGLGCDDGTKAYLVSMALFASGVSTFIQCRRFGPIGARLLCVQGTSFQFLTPSIIAGQAGVAAAVAAAKSAGVEPGDAAAYAYGLPLVFGCCFAAAPVEMIASLAFRHLRKIITPVVSGTVVMLIGLSLVKVGLITAAGGFGSMAEGARYPFGCWQNALVAAVVLFSILFFNCFKNRYLRMSSVVLGIILGYVVAACFGMVHFNTPEWASINVPHPLKWGLQFNLGTIVGFGFIYLVTAIEAAGDMTANSLISGLSIDDESYAKRVSGGVLADGFNSALACVFNSFPNSVFAQNNGIIQLTGVASRYVGYWIAGMLVILGLYPAVGTFLSTMPDPVLGGATLLAFGMVASAGIRIVAQSAFTHKSALVLAVALAAGMGVELVPDVFKYLPDTLKQIFSSGIVTGGLVAIVANLVIPEEK